MAIPYRTQRTIKRVLSACLVVAILLVAICVCGMIWVQRYIVYAADGSVRIDFSLPPLTAGKPATPPQRLDITISFDEKPQKPTGELTQLQGYYIEQEDLADIPALLEQLKELPAGTPVMVDVKSIRGDFYYSSSVSSRRSSQVNTADMDNLIAYLKDSGLYTIARVPAFRDYAHGLANVSDGVYHSSGGYLHMDAEGCYWLNPAREGTISYLTKIITELRSLGFQEVMLTDFSFPESNNILVNGDRQEILTEAAKILLTACSNDSFALSFEMTEEFTAPEGRSRIYLSGLTATEAEQAVQNSTLPDPKINLVFLTELFDTRFDEFSVLRPIAGA